MQTRTSTTSPRYANAYLFFRNAVLSWGLAVLLLMGNVPTAQAQSADLLAQGLAEEIANTEIASTSSDELARIPLKVASATWLKNFGAQCAEQLASDNDHIRSSTLQNVVYFATNNSDVIDFSKTQPELFTVYAHDPVEAHRIMAATALHAIALSQPAPGNDYIMENLNTLMYEERSKRVRRHTLNVLADYYKRQGKKLYVDSWLYITTMR